MNVLTVARARLGQSAFRRGVLSLVGGTIFAQIIVVVTSPILTRLYVPSEFGAYATAMAIMGLLVTVSCLSYDFAIGLPENDVVAANLLCLCLVASLCVGCATAVLLLAVGGELLVLAGATSLSQYALLLPLGQVSGSIVAALTVWAVRNKAFPEVAAVTRTRSVSLVATQIGLGIVGSGAVGLLIGGVVGFAAGAGRLARWAWRGSAGVFRQVSRVGVVEAAKRYRRFAILSTPSVFLNSLGLRLPLLLLVTVFGVEVAGQYALADRVIALPVTLLASAVGNVFYAEAAPLARDDPSELRALFLKTTRSLALVGIGPMIVAIVAAPLLFTAVFGQAWGQAGTFVAILAPWYFLMLVANPTGPTLDVLERQDLFLVREIVRILLLGGVAILITVLHLSATGAVVAVGVVGCLTYGLYWLMSWWAIRSAIRMRLIGTPWQATTREDASVRMPNEHMVDDPGDLGS